MASRTSPVGSACGFAPRFPLPWTRTLLELAYVELFDYERGTSFIVARRATAAICIELLICSQDRTNWIEMGPFSR